MKFNWRTVYPLFGFAIVFLQLYLMIVSGVYADELAETDVRLVSNANFENWEIILGFLSPIVLQFILQSKWTPRIQSLSAFAFYMLTTFIGQQLKGAFAVDDWFGSTLKVAIIAIPLYLGLVKPVVGSLKEATDLNPT